MASEINQLSGIIHSSVKDLLALSAANDWSLPELNKPFNPATSTFRTNPDAARMSAKIIAAAMQLAMTLMAPKQSVYSFLEGPLKAAALRVCLGTHVPEIVSEAGPEGLHITQITERMGPQKVDSAKLGRIMRLLANNHVFREVKPDVFAHSMHSSILDVRKPVDEILANPAAKHDGTLGLAALWEYSLDEAAKSSTMLFRKHDGP